MNEAGQAQGRLDEQLVGVGFAPTYLRSEAAALDELELYAATCESVILDWRGAEAKDPCLAAALTSKAAALGLPVVAFVSGERQDDMRVASEAGIATVLRTPCRLGDLKQILDDLSARRAPANGGQDFDLTGAAALLESCKFRFRTPADVERLAPIVAQLMPDPERRIAGIAELMMNAIEHGNLEIGRERKAEWLASGIYETELARRLEMPPFAARRAELIVNRREDGLMIVIMDEGCGFCWQNIINNDVAQSDMPAEPCGNGIARAKRESFDDLRFNHLGNQVSAFVESGSPPA